MMNEERKRNCTLLPQRVYRSAFSVPQVVGAERLELPTFAL
jgi:hypothetical protein